MTLTIQYYIRQPTENNCTFNTVILQQDAFQRSTEILLRVTEKTCIIKIKIITCSTILFITNKTRAYERSPWNMNGLSELGLKTWENSRKFRNAISPKW
jgi:hypothetical protein